MKTRGRRGVPAFAPQFAWLIDVDSMGNSAIGSTTVRRWAVVRNQALS